MKIVQINQVSGYGSTGHIVEDISAMLCDKGVDNRIYYGLGQTKNVNAVRFETDAQLKMHKLYSRLTGRHGFASKRATENLIQALRKYAPDIIHLHNLHGFYINLPLLFSYIKEADIPVVWTLHDCWAFTGHCAHFDHAKCAKWKTGCGRCPQRFEYPRALIDASAVNFSVKKKLFTGLRCCTVVTPSNWLAKLVGESFLREYPVCVIPNGIDTAVFAPTGIEKNGRVVLACAPSLNENDLKGGGYLPGLAAALDSDHEVQVLGLDSARTCPPGITALGYIQDQTQLAEIYSSAAVFVNPTLQDNFPMVNLEALSCGTPVVTFDTGGSAEMLTADTGAVVKKGDLAALTEKTKDWSGRRCSSACRQRGLEYDKKEMYEKYFSLYCEVLSAEKRGPKN